MICNSHLYIHSREISGEWWGTFPVMPYRIEHQTPLLKTWSAAIDAGTSLISLGYWLSQHWSSLRILNGFTSLRHCSLFPVSGDPRSTTRWFCFSNSQWSKRLFSLQDIEAVFVPERALEDSLIIWMRFVWNRNKQLDDCRDSQRPLIWSCWFDSVDSVLTITTCRRIVVPLQETLMESNTIACPAEH
jgi:hypothetical protein